MPSCASIDPGVDPSAHAFHLLFPLRAEPGRDRLVVRAPARHWIVRGALGLLVGPMLAGIVWLRFAFDDLDPGVAIPLQGLVLGAGGLFALVGLGMMAISPLLSARSAITFDRASIWRARDDARIATSSISRVRVRALPGLARHHVLELVPQVVASEPSANPYRAPEAGTFVLHARLPPVPGDLAVIAHVCGAFLGVPVDAPAYDRHAPTIREEQAAMLCYLPVAGVFLFASIWFLARDPRPTVRFAAKQSLLQSALSFVVLALLLGVTSVFFVTSKGETGLDALIVPLLAIWLAFFAWNLGAYVLACVRASRGVLWSMPWLRPFLKPPT